MRKRRRRKIVPASPPPPERPGLVDEYALDGWTVHVGDEVRIRARRQGGRRGRGVVKAIVTDPDTQELRWVEVWGGTAGHSQFNALRSDRLMPVRRRRSK